MYTTQNVKMSSSIGGFTAPSIITHYWLRTPDQVSLSNDGREFAPSALISPLLSLVVLTLTCISGEPQKIVGSETIKADDIQSPDETTPLGRGSDVIATPKKRRLSLAEAGRSASIRGSLLSPMTLIPPNDDIYEDIGDIYV
mmetsp:Transcript_4700/g.10111  ORF Transcript_4700/g.10111 Transcript_4700/m.10111 type:complete len:142 (+) Transcript_4700:46-471(+)